MSNKELLNYIVIDQEIRFGKPCIKGTRITVGDILQWLSEDISVLEILEDYPLLKEIHIKAALAFAARREEMIKVIAVAWKIKIKILLDANISWKLAEILKPIYGECDHVDFIGLNVPAMDKDIWNYALNNGYIIITKDTDFVDLMELKGFPPKIVLLKTGNNGSQSLAELLKSTKSLIEDLEKNNYGLLEIVKKK
jgi:uncharacterized protein (DUF433 family)/predicted nuclease of predicted toxin-antitoxin system